MDDLNKEVLAVWGFRLKLERIKKRLQRIEFLMQTEEYNLTFNQLEKIQMEIEIKLLRVERDELEIQQLQLEEKIKLPNPYLNFLD